MLFFKMLFLPPHIFSVQVKLRSVLHHGSASASLKQNKRNLTLTLILTLNILLPSIVFHNKIKVFIIFFMTFSFLRLIHGLFIYEEVMSVRLYATLN